MQVCKVIVNKSTVPLAPLTRCRPPGALGGGYARLRSAFHVVNNPESLKEGTAVNNFLKPDRIFVDTESELVQTLVHKLYYSFILVIS